MTPEAALDPLTARQTPVSGRWIALFSLAWLGLWMTQLTAIQLLLPDQVAAATSSAQWQSTLRVFGLVSAVAGLVALVAYPVSGAFSDRTTSRWGRRRPWVVGGVLLSAGCYALIGIQHSIVGMTIFWSLSTAGFCAASSGLTAMICDRVPVEQRGFVSGWIAVPQALGVVVGVALASGVITGPTAGYGLLAALLSLLTVPFVVLEPDPPAPPRTAGTTPLLGWLWISPREHPDFGWALLSRTLVNLANALGTGLLLYFFTYDLELDDPAGFLATTTVIYVACAVLGSVLLGRVSDRVGRRKPFVLIAGVLQAASALLLASLPSVGTAIVGALLVGAGTGAYFSVDQALATQVLPNPADHGKDLAIMNLALIVPQAAGPLLGAFAVAAFGGFSGLYWVAGVAGLLGALAVLPIRGAA
ncbi:MFS transporter [Cryptosporangium sp. NPDC048952]|uniref:MFS transporter n=1 Tax=Cryptosporangium sp. NPDC048952 TaxID=3363961 RepID=UPI003714F0C3